ncbi:MAG TPA: ABC transporter ATP-binding protein [Stellaceae bacterium]|nr:ABC transporter ATP-binding protein [Stellaceae bacterium]
MAEALLAVEGLTKRFGGLAATDRASLQVEEGTIHALIGPNGAGKSTLIAEIAGEIEPDAGRIRFAGQDITALPVAQRVKRGLVRSYQITSIFPGLSALGNVAIAVQATQGNSYRFWSRARRDPRLLDPARALLEEFGLGPRAAIRAADLAHGEQRQLELAMALATGPRLLLLDEPMAGMGAEESAAIVEALGRLKGRITMLLVEHDMDAVFALANRITVMVYGRPIASGDAAAIRANPEVRAAYLGEGDA